MIICREHGLKKNESFYGSGLLALHCNNYSLAFQRFTYLLELARKSEEKTSAGILLSGLAAVAGGTNQPECAARLYGAALTILDTTGQTLASLDQAEFERQIQIAHDQLGEATLE
jgi:hypothetical protein